MYYWSKVTSEKTSLEEELLSIDKIKELYIGTAFFSVEGLGILKKIIGKYTLKKDNIFVYLSDEFTHDKPHELLREIRDLAQVKIFFNHTFHSKVYLIKGNINKVIFGSSNFTSGGFVKNIEFDSIEQVEDVKLAEFERFFKFCDFHSTEVTGDIIKFYEENAAELEALRQTQKKLRKKMKGYIRQGDPMDPDDLNIEGYYFTFTDYETFFGRNMSREDADIRAQRKEVQKKMLALHEQTYPKIKKLGISCHWNPQHVTSLIKPCDYNKGKVNWLGIRYGKSKKEVDVVNELLDKNEKDEIKGFQKHGCLQFCITPTGFEINLFLAVRHDAIDRSHVQENLVKLEKAIVKELQKLKGNGMTWEIVNDVSQDFYSFEIDNRHAADFCDFLKKYDKDGCESYLRLFYPADHENLADKDTICEVIIKYMKMLTPLYNAMVWRPKV